MFLSSAENLTFSISFLVDIIVLGCFCLESVFGFVFFLLQLWESAMHFSPGLPLWPCSTWNTLLSGVFIYLFFVLFMFDL